MSHKSESQHDYIGTCPHCASPLYLFESKVDHHECPSHDWFENLMDRCDMHIKNINASNLKIAKYERKLNGFT
jgi:hypothetical protein